MRIIFKSGWPKEDDNLDSTMKDNLIDTYNQLKATYSKDEREWYLVRVGFNRALGEVGYRIIE